MVKFNIEIETTDRINNRTILTATVNNGNWKVWEAWQDETSETPLTINTIKNFSYVNQPVKFVCKNYELVNGELIANGEETRLYDSLIDFLSVAIGWAKDSTLTEKEHKIILMDNYMRLAEIASESEVIYKEDEKATVKITRED